MTGCHVDPILRSVEPGETWSWCVVDEVGFVLQGRSNVSG
jgi:hypothetical protein